MNEPLEFLRRGRERMIEMLERAHIGPPEFARSQRDPGYLDDTDEKRPDEDPAKPNL